MQQLMLQRLLLRAAVSLSLLASAQRPKKVDTSYLEVRLPPELAGDSWAGPLTTKVSAIYEIDAGNWERFIRRPPNQLAQALGLQNLNVEVDSYVKLTSEKDSFDQTGRCRPGMLKCSLSPSKPDILVGAPGVGGTGPDSTLFDVDPHSCRSWTNAISTVGPESSATRYHEGDGKVYDELLWNPMWDDDDTGTKLHKSEDFINLVWDTPFCVSNRNTSLLIYPDTLNNTYVTGERSNNNLVIRSGDEHYLTLHIKGRIPSRWAIFFNEKFVLNYSVPLPEIQPEVFDELADWTDELDYRSTIFAVREGGREYQDANKLRDFLPICEDPPMLMQGCFRVDFNIYQRVMSEYEMWYRIMQRGFLLPETASDQTKGEFNLSAGPWPRMTTMPAFAYQPVPGPWQVRSFPQKKWRPPTGCETGVACGCSGCPDLPMVPSARSSHSAVLYTTWNFSLHARTYLCNDNPKCGSDCLTNFTCLGGKEKYFSDFFYFRSSTFKFDDGGDVPFVPVDAENCPDTCCRDRRTCMRVRDAMGYFVPYDTVMMLVFGGKSYVHEKDTDPNSPWYGRLIYHKCERIDLGRTDVDRRSCTEKVTNDLWRYNVMAARWEFIKPQSAIDLTTQKPMGYPLARYAHGATILEQIDDKEPASKQVWMFIFGGLGPQCAGGVCRDVWKYEVAFAAQAYYPKFPSGEWTRGNLWYKLKDCPFGGLYRHQMITNSQNEFIYVYGGQKIGTFSHQLLKYKVSTDTWEDMEPFGRISLTRMMYDYAGTPRVIQVDTDEYNEEIDVDCKLAWRFDGKTAHCRMCPQCRLAIAERGGDSRLPDERGDFAMLPFLDDSTGATDDRVVLFGGYRTTWGVFRDRDDACSMKTTLPPKMDVITTTTAPPPPPPDWVLELGPVAPDPSEIGLLPTLNFSSTRAPTTTTTTREKGLLDEFAQAGGDSVGTADDEPSEDPSLVSQDTILKGNPSQPTGQEEPEKPLWETGVSADDVPRTTVTTTSSTTSTTPPPTTTTTSAPPTPPPPDATTRTTTRRPTPPPTFPPPPQSSTVTTTTIAQTTTTTNYMQIPVISGRATGGGLGGNQTLRNQEINPPTFLEGPCTNGEVPRYYYDDLWIYETSVNQWRARKTTGDLPHARRGHAMIARRQRTNDTQLIMVGGHYQDDPYGDMWVLNLMRNDPEERTWTRVDQFFTGMAPPPLTYHSMVYSEPLRRLIIFGGLHWKPTDKQDADALRNIDRRCLKEAQGLPELYDGLPEAEFLVKMQKLCLRPDMQFCCQIGQIYEPGAPVKVIDEVVVRTSDNYLNLTALSIVCRKDCEEKKFYTEFYPKFVEGVYTFQVDKCENNCSNHGYCDLSQCVCEPEWYGVDCSLPRCPGSTCYTHPRTKEQFCVDCSQNGRCVYGGCQCFAGWGLEDCSAPLCEANCSSTPYETRGVCVADFPVHQCSCIGKWSGTNCSDLVCLNGCSGRGRCVQGKCHCQDMYYGDDCSVFVFDPGHKPQPSKSESDSESESG